ncbi:MAG: type II toxin-antitoxin system Phd/YefM family antitoxin [Actinobacteria bacterium]|nr:type II toxin-antitoxin system Phd/YefM family antitoxin [Actinomycetota bacterium]
MNFVSVREFRTNPAKIWEKLKKDMEIIITSNGKPIAVLNPIYENDVEGTLDIIRRIKAVKAFESLQEDAVRKGLDKLTDEEIDKIIKSTRQQRKISGEK